MAAASMAAEAEGAKGLLMRRVLLTAVGSAARFFALTRAAMAYSTHHANFSLRRRRMLQRVSVIVQP